MTNKSNPILLILGIPPPFGGGEILGETIVKKFKDNEKFRIYTYSRIRGNKSTQGRASIGNILFGFGHIIKCLGLILKLRPKKIFLSIPKNFGAFLRTAPIILFASLMRTKVYGELAGAQFLFLNKGWKKTIGLFVLRRIYSIRFLGENIKKIHTKYKLQNPIVFSNGIQLPTDQTHKSIQNQRPLHLLTVGALNRSKGTGRIIEAIALCREKGLDITCTLIGEWNDPELKSDMNQFITKHKLNKQIHFTGLIKGEKKWDYFRSADILVHPTDWDGQPLTILEAIGMGLAIISTPVGAIPNTVDHLKNGILLKKNTPKSLCEAISELYFDRKKLTQIMKYNQKDFNRRFTVEIYLENLSNWLQGV